MSIIIFGVDPSSKKIALTVTTLGDDTSLTMHTTPLHKTRADLACHAAHAWLHGIASKYRANGDEVIVFLEEPVFGRGGPRATIPQARTNGAMLAACVSANVEVVNVNNQRWKKVVLGKGSAGKPEIASMMKELWGDAYKMANGDQDLIDSAAINRYGVSVIKMRERIKRDRQTTTPTPKAGRVMPKRLSKRLS